MGNSKSSLRLCPQACSRAPKRGFPQEARRSNEASILTVRAVSSELNGPFAAPHLPPRTEARRLSTVGLRKRRWLSGARRQARNVRPIGHPNGRGGWGWGWVRRELAHAGAAERSPPPGPQRWAADRVRRRRRLEATLGFENQREIAKAGTIGVAGPPREIGEKHMGCGVLCSKLYSYTTWLAMKNTFS